MSRIRTMTGISEASDHVAVLAPVMGAILLAAILLFGTGLSTIAAVHNAAHDARHAFAFPCH
jgi:cobalt transporter subunit CbtB